MDLVAAAGFLAMVFVISISGAFMPGPVMAGTLTRSLEDRHAGAKVALGHALIEIPLIILVALGMGAVLDDTGPLFVIGVVGGVVLLYMGIGALRGNGAMSTTESKGSTVMMGLVTTASNPYFYVWWVTVGAALVATAMEMSMLVLPLLVVVHLSCDLGWFEVMSLSVHRSRAWAGERLLRPLMVISGTIMLVFGAYFIWSSIGML